MTRPRIVRGKPSSSGSPAESPYWLSRAIEAQVVQVIPEIVRAHTRSQSARSASESQDAGPAPSRSAGAVVGGVATPQVAAQEPLRFGAEPTLAPERSHLRPTEREVTAAAACGVKGDHAGLRDIVMSLRARAVPIGTICLDLLGAAARHLGDRWTEDEVNFVEVTYATGVFESALRELMPALDAELTSQHGDADEVGRILLADLPEESHRLGLMIVGGFFRGAGWAVRESQGMTLAELEKLVAVEWFEVIGLSASCDRHIDLLSLTLTRLRRRSCNPAVGFLVGGAQFAQRPSLVQLVGADATAVDASDALLQAQRLRERSRAAASITNT